MSVGHRIETAIAAALRGTRAGMAPDRLAGAIDYAVLPGGARVRPGILIAVATACGDDLPELTDTAAAALELIHCASLVHDDLPCFDNAEIRRGKASVHRAYSEPLAVLAGDSLMILAYDVLARAGSAPADRQVALVRTLAQRSGMPNGICAGQGWESEPEIDLSAYHRSKTAALFIAATEMGAICAGHDPAPWQDLGALIGEAFQVADDLRDVLLDADALGKPVGQDVLHGRPNAVRELGIDGAFARYDAILAAAIASIPSCPGEAMLAQMVKLQAAQIVPRTPARFRA